MDVRLLGQIEALDGEPLPLAGPTQRRVLAALALRRNEVVSVGHLVEVIWPDRQPPDRAEHNVRTYVHRLRSSLNGSDDRIETVGAGYRMSLATAELDAAQFEQLAQTASRLAAMGEAAETLDAIAEAEQLWHGNPVEEFEHEAWAAPDVVRLRETHVELMTQRADTLIQIGRPAEAVGELEALVRDEPLRERPRALLMRALYESGRQAEALRAFQDFRRLLVDEVGVEPSSDLVQLDRAIASGELTQAGADRRTVGNYELHERIGEGAFAVVHRATQTSLGREVAVKVVRAELANRPEFIRRFEAEAQTIAAIEHPNVVPLYDYWREPDRAFLVMRWMAGGSLETRLDDGRWSLDETVELVEQIGSALDAAHRAGVVHRDVKPANILFDADDRAYLGDFGIALGDAERATPEAALSEGSPVFASPEQLRREPVGPEADVHALAVVAFTVLTGRTPFADAPDEATLLRRQLHDPIPPAASARPDVPPAVDEVLGVATAKEPSDRYPTAAGFATALRAAASGDVATVSLPIDIHDRVNPYLGLRAFAEADAATFFGRERLVDELTDHLAAPDQNVLAVVGPSGSGKSSAVRAGLVPALRAGRVPGSERWFVTTMTPGDHPFEALETALLRIAVNPPGSLLDQLRDGDRGILRGVRRIVHDDDGVVVVVIDQFEELFTNELPEAERDQFLRAVAVAATEPASPLRVVLTLRADFYDEPLRHPEFAPLMKRDTVVVTPLAPDELEAAITQPAATAGVGFAPGLVAEVVADVNSQPGALPLLQFALTQSFDRVEGSTIGVDDYRAVGGLSGALAQRADDVWHELPTEAQPAARRLFGRLVTLGDGTEDTRRRVDRSELPADVATDEAIDAFGRARLLTFDHNPATREPTIEIAHEALIREWQRLRGWLDDDRDTLRVQRHLTTAAAGWADRDRDANELYRGARLDAAAPLLTSEAVALNETETEFLRASVRRRDDEVVEEQRRLRRLHRLVAATAVVAAMALIAGVVALVQWRRADDQAADAASNAELAAASARDADDRAEEAEQARGEAVSAALIADEERVRADENATLADDRATEAEAARLQADLERLRAVARAIAPENPTTAALLAAEAYAIDSSIESLDLLHRVLTAVPGYRGSISADRYFQADLLDDGITLAVVGREGLDVWDLSTRELVRSIPLPESSETVGLDATGDGRVAAIRAETDEIILVDVTTGASIGSIAAGTRVNDVSVSPDGRLLALAGGNGTVEIWDVGAAQLVTVLETGANSVTLARWSPNGDRIAVGTNSSGNSIVQLWDPALPEPLWTDVQEGLSILTDAVTTMLFSSDGERLVVSVGWLSGHLRVYDTSDGTQPHPPTRRQREGTGRDAMYWIDEQALVIASPTSEGVPVYDLATGVSRGLTRQVGAGLFDVVFSPELDLVVAAGLGGVELWSNDGSGPLEQIVPYTADQRAALDVNGGTTHATVSADGSRLVTSVLALPDRPATSAYSLTEGGATLTDFGRPGALVYGNGEHTMTFDLAALSFALVDADDVPVGDPVPFSFDLTDQDASDDGRFIALGRSGGLIDLYTGAGGAVATLDMGPLPAEDGGLIKPSLSADGEYVAAATEQGTFVVWSTDTLERVDLGTARGGAHFAGNWLAVYDDEELRLLDPRTGEEVGGPFLNPPSGGFFYPVVDAANGRIAATGGDIVKVYDIETGQQLGRELPYQPIRIEYTADGSVLAVAGDVGVSLWNYDTDTWADIACEIAGRNLTRAEWAQLGPRTAEYRATCDEYPVER